MSTSVYILSINTTRWMNNFLLPMYGPFSPRPTTFSQSIINITTNWLTPHWNKLKNHFSLNIYFKNNQSSRRWTRRQSQYHRANPICYTSRTSRGQTNRERVDAPDVQQSPVAECAPTVRSGDWERRRVTSVRVPRESWDKCVYLYSWQVYP